jgi:hypothetical protein
MVGLGFKVIEKREREGNVKFACTITLWLANRRTVVRKDDFLDLVLLWLCLRT